MTGAVAIQPLVALAKAAPEIAAMLARHPSAQRIAVRGNVARRLSKLNERKRRAWYRDLEAACDDLEEAVEEGNEGAKLNAVLRLLNLGVTQEMLDVAITAVALLP